MQESSLEALLGISTVCMACPLLLQLCSRALRHSLRTASELDACLHSPSQDLNPLSRQSQGLMTAGVPSGLSDLPDSLLLHVTSCWRCIANTSMSVLQHNLRSSVTACCLSRQAVRSVSHVGPAWHLSCIIRHCG